MLPYPSMSGWALIYLLTKWGFCKPRQGGMANPRHQTACQDLLEVIWEMICASTDQPALNLVIELINQWSIPWPRPRCCAHRINLSIGKDGRVDMHSFLLDLNRKVQNVGMQQVGWWSASSLKDLLDLGPDPSWLLVLARTSSNKRLHPLHCQVLWMLGLLFQQVMLDVIDKKNPT